MVHPQFFEIGRMTKELGFVVRVRTNGHTLSPRNVERLRHEVDPYMVEVSLHGATAESHDRLTRVPGSFDRLLANLAAMRAAGLRVRLTTILTRWNEHEIGSTLALADRLDLRLDVDPEVTPRDGGDRAPLAIATTRDGLEALRRTQSERAGAAGATPAPEGEGAAAIVVRKHCGAGSSSVTVDPYGNVFPCVQWRRPLGSLREQSIAEIWSTSAELRTVRELTERAKRMVDARPAEERLIRFCPGLAEAHTGDPLGVYASCRELSAVFLPTLPPRPPRHEHDRPAVDCEGS